MLIAPISGQYKSDTPLGKLMQDFASTNPKDMNYPQLAQRAKYLNEDTEGVTTMCKMMEEAAREAY